MKLSALDPEVHVNITEDIAPPLFLHVLRSGSLHPDFVVDALRHVQEDYEYQTPVVSPLAEVETTGPFTVEEDDIPTDTFDQFWSESDETQGFFKRHFGRKE